MFDEKLFNEFKKDTSAALKIPIAGTIIGVSADYKDFQQKRQEYFQKIGYYSTEEDASDDALDVGTGGTAYRTL
jgi:hypothetical protein